MMCSPLGSLGTRSVQTMMDHVGAPERSPTGTALYYDAKLMKACSLFYTCSCICLRMCKLFPKCFSALILNFTRNAIRTSIVDAVTQLPRERRHVWTAMWSTKIASQVPGKCLFLALLASTVPDVPVKSLRCCSSQGMFSGLNEQKAECEGTEPLTHMGWALVTISS